MKDLGFMRRPFALHVLGRCCSGCSVGSAPEGSDTGHEVLVGWLVGWLIGL
jgi:hypothetical protein